MPRRRSGFAKKIQSTHWTYGSFAFNAHGVGISAVNLFSAQHLPETLLRTRGEYVAAVDGLAATPTLIACGLGFAQVPEGTGTTPLWSPLTDGDAPWFWVDYFMMGYEELVTDVIDIPMLTGVRRVIDSKAMRIVRNREIQAVLETATVIAAETINVNGQVRTLFGS